MNIEDCDHYRFVVISATPYEIVAVCQDCEACLISENETDWRLFGTDKSNAQI